MERRKAITTAAAASLTLLAGAAGIALNSGILESADDNVGQLSPVSNTSPPVTLVIDEPLPASSTVLPGAAPATVAPPASFAPPVTASAQAPVTTSSASTVGDDDHDEDDEDDEYEDDEDEDHEDDDHEDDDHEEYEGGEDDD